MFKNSITPFRLLSRSFSSGPTFKMPVTELVFPSYKQDPQSLAELKEKRSEIFQHFSGVDGLEAAFYGTLLEENGVSVDPKSMKTVLVLEWDNLSSFQTFFPKSPQFGGFVSTIKDFVSGPASPELYEAEERSTSCTTSNVLQLIKVEASKETEEAWRLLANIVTKIAEDKPNFYHANGIEKDETTFLGLIGWNSLQEYERVGKHTGVLGVVRDLSKGGKLQNVVAQLTPFSEL